MKKWRVGIIGVGGIFNGAHREHYLKDDRLEVVALCDIIEERAVECRDGFFPDAKVYTDFNELLKDETIDSVDICTPNYPHSTKPNQFCLEIILCRIRGAFDYLMYPYYPAYMG